MPMDDQRELMQIYDAIHKRLRRWQIPGRTTRPGHLSVSSKFREADRFYITPREPGSKIAFSRMLSA